MDKKRTTKGRALRALAVFVAILAVFPIQAVCAADNNPLYITVEQQYDASPSNSGNAVFTYRLESIPTGNPMPTEQAEYTFTINGNDSAQIGPISYDESGLYQYKLSQVIESEKQGYTYDKQAYAINVIVEEDLGVMVVVFNEDDEKEADIVFANKYSSGGGGGTNPPTDPPSTNPPTSPPPTTPSPTPPPPTPPPATNPPTTNPQPDPSDPPPSTQQPPNTPPPPPGNNFVPDGDGFIEVDDDGIPLGRWEWDDEEEEWVFTETPPLSGWPESLYPDIPKTGDDRNTALHWMMLIMGFTMTAGSTIFLLTGKKRQGGDRR